MDFKPLVRMWERVDVGRQDSDTALFMELMYFGEMVTKLIVSALVAAIGDDRDRLRYSYTHRLVRADGIGDWAKAAGEILKGPASQHLVDDARTEQKELTEKLGRGSWQWEAASALHSCLSLVDPSCEPLPTKVDGERWIREFARLRNKTRGHGATASALYGQLCPCLEQSIRVITDNHRLFSRGWAYLYRNLSGKYRVTALTQTTDEFERLKRTSTEHHSNGVYIDFGHVAKVELMDSTADASDFYFANGGFTDHRFEMLSYLSGEVILPDATPYLGPIGPLPVSETQGLANLDVQGKTFGNLPPTPPGYISREQLEKELVDTLADDRHPVVTLVGRGGIGKTSLALAATHALASLERFEVMLWFSARDLDLLTEGPKPVRPAVLNVKDVAKEFVTLLQPAGASEKSFRAEEYIAECLTKSPVGPLLLVFDNFETLSSPVDFYNWIDAHIRSPNKVLITTRQREFKGDYPIEVTGMLDYEFNQLIDATAARLGIKDLMTGEYRQELFRESDGHPYVVKILLGEVAKARKLVAITRVFADADEVLTALFERTWASLSPAAQRVLLTLCHWRSTIPLLALQAVLLRPSTEKMSVQDAVDELERSSFVELIQSAADGQFFVTTPFVAAMFGRRKVAVSPLKSIVEADTEMLQHFGAGQKVDVRHGFGPRVQRLVKFVAEGVGRNPAVLDDYLPMLEYIAGHYPPAWGQIAKLHEESGEAGGMEAAKAAIRSYLEVASADQAGPLWRELAELCRVTEDAIGEVQALVEMSNLPSTPLRELSNAANRFNSLVREQKTAFEMDVRQILARRLLAAMENRIQEADATDCSRMAWLCLILDDTDKATTYTKMGLKIDPQNEYCQNLKARLAI